VFCCLAYHNAASRYRTWDEVLTESSFRANLGEIKGHCRYSSAEGPALLRGKAALATKT